MNKICLLIILSLVVSAVSAQQKNVTIKGVTMNIESLDPIASPNIETVKGHKKYRGNSNGVFIITVQRDDSVYISALGYTRVTIAVKQIMPQHPGDSVLILLKPVAYQLRDVMVIRASRHRDSLARAAAHLLATDSLLNDFSRIYNRPRGRVYVGSGVIYEGAIQELYNQFSKEGKDHVHFEEFVEYSRHLKKVEQRYNREIAMKVTGIDESEMDAFMMFCKLDKGFVVNAQEYDLLVAIKKCGEDFKAQKK